MGLNDAKKMVLKHLTRGSVQHEARGMIHEKKLLQVGDVTPAQVAKLINATKGCHYKTMPHEEDASIEVHIFEPEAKLDSDQEKFDWHIKVYEIDPNAVFISVHRSHVKKSTSRRGDK